jgi:uncharacterized protein YfbU (UPF0304 family)
LEKLYPDEADSFEKRRTALEQGYALHYEWIVENVWDDLPEEECKRVLNALDVYRAITFSYDSLDDKANLTDADVRFRGFDGNNESHHMSYARYFVVDLGRYDELQKGQEYPNFNSHMPMLKSYDRMYSLWDSWGRPMRMSAEMLRTLLNP